MPRKKKPGPKCPPEYANVRIAPIPVRYKLRLEEWIERTNIRRRERNPDAPLITTKGLINTLIRRARADYAKDARNLLAHAIDELPPVDKGNHTRENSFMIVAIDKDLAARVQTFLEGYPSYSRARVLAYLVRGWLEVRVLGSSEYVHPIPRERIYWCRSDPRSPGDNYSACSGSVPKAMKNFFSAPDLEV